MQKLFFNIKKLYACHRGESKFLKGDEMKNLPFIENAWILTRKGIIEDFGSMDNFPMEVDGYDMQGRVVLPTYVDSHTHLVYAQSREQEFRMRIEGKTYEEIAAAGGGILNSAQMLANMCEEQLFEEGLARLKSLIKLGTGAIEIKSGYGLNTEAEIKMLRVIKRLKDENLIPIKATFLGAHAYPKIYQNNKSAYVDLIIHEMLPEIAAENLADYVDVFCEENYFSVADTIRLMKAGKQYGLKAKIHVNQFTNKGGLAAAVENGALSVDHLEVLSDAEINCLKTGKTIACVLPACSFFIEIPYAPARKMIDNGLGIVLASDFNPGSSPTGNMSFVNALACIKMKLLPEESFNAATNNAAFALELENEVGSISPGKRANFMVLKKDFDVSSIPYHFGENLIEEVYINGRLFG